MMAKQKRPEIIGFEPSQLVCISVLEGEFGYKPGSQYFRDRLTRAGIRHVQRFVRWGEILEKWDQFADPFGRADANDRRSPRNFSYLDTADVT